jgi:hypothetical protein
MLTDADFSQCAPSSGQEKIPEKVDSGRETANGQRHRPRDYPEKEKASDQQER